MALNAHSKQASYCTPHNPCAVFSLSPEAPPPPSLLLALWRLRSICAWSAPCRGTTTAALLPLGWPLLLIIIVIILIVLIIIVIIAVDEKRM